MYGYEFFGDGISFINFSESFLFDNNLMVEYTIVIAARILAT
jgi:hypothetical protein